MRHWLAGVLAKENPARFRPTPRKFQSRLSIARTSTSPRPSPRERRGRTIVRVSSTAANCCRFSGQEILYALCPPSVARLLRRTGVLLWPQNSCQFVKFVSKFSFVFRGFNLSHLRSFRLRFTTTARQAAVKALRVGFDKKDFLRMFAPPSVQARAHKWAKHSSLPRNRPSPATSPRRLASSRRHDDYYETTTTSSPRRSAICSNWFCRRASRPSAANGRSNASRSSRRISICSRLRRSKTG